MRTVSACACARVQSRLNAAAAAAEVFSSVLREVGTVSSLALYLFVFFVTKYLNNTPESQHARCLGGRGKAELEPARRQRNCFSIYRRRCSGAGSSPTWFNPKSIHPSSRSSRIHSVRYERRRLPAQLGALYIVIATSIHASIVL